MHLTELQQNVWQGMEKQGFHNGRSGRGRDDNFARLVLIHTEVSEACQVVKRHGLEDEKYVEMYAEELADVLIRLLDLAGCVGINLEEAAIKKQAVNMQRPYMYGTPQVVK